VKRVPLRIRLTAGFAIVMAVLLTAAGFYIYARVASDLDASIDRALRARTADVSALVQQADTGLSEAQSPGLVEAGADFAQVINAKGLVTDATPGFRGRPLLTGAELQRARQRTVLLDERELPGLESHVRLLAHPITTQEQRLVIVTGASLEDRNAALTRLRHVMLAGGPVILLLACLAGYGLAAMALRPVERMRRRAESISTHQLHTRLPRSGSGDELDRLATTLNEGLDRLEAGIARQHDFVADASHELRTPLTVLRTQLDLIASEEPTPPLLQQEIASAIEEVDRLARLADDLLLLARSDRDELTLAAEPIELGRVLARVAERMRRGDPGAIIARPLDDELWARGDERRIEQAIENLAENALRHGAEPVVLAARERDGSAELHVLDEGPGLPSGFAETAFERFTQAHAGRTHQGAGLGLAIVRAIAEAHGGTAHVANRPEGGADAWISLPLQAGAQPPSIVSAQSSDGR
jgi:signal transduction histidine kinase